LELNTLNSPNEYNFTQTMQASGVSGGTYYWYNASNSQVGSGSTYNPNNHTEDLYKARVVREACWSGYENITATMYRILRLCHLRRSPVGIHDLHGVRLPPG
jgi:hypothetical protein